MITKRSELLLEPGIEKYFVPSYDKSWGPSYTPIHSKVFEKIASSTYVPDRIIQIIEKLKPREDGRYIHINAVGEEKTWGSNRNGDLFPKWSLLGDTPPPDVDAFLKEKGLSIAPEYGYKTFESYAYPFMFHDNKDPVHSIGERVICAAYNPPMERVELILFILTQKAPALVARIDAGKEIGWSMGCKVPFDVCTICKNTAKNRGEYCEHLRTLMNVILPDGRKVAAINMFPRFFDISYVLSPAWSPAYALRKVAGTGMVADPEAVSLEYAPTRLDFEKVASAQATMRWASDALTTDYSEKIADIVKKIPAERGQDNLGTSPIKPGAWKMLKNLVNRDSEHSGYIPSSLLERLRDEHGSSGLINGATALGIQFKRPEIEVITRGSEDNVPSTLDLDNIAPRLLSDLRDLVPERSLFDPPFAKRVIRIIRIKQASPGLLDKMSSTAYEKYAGLLRSVDAEQLLKVATRGDILMARDPDAIENSVLGVKTATENRFQPILPWLAGAAVK